MVNNSRPTILNVFFVEPWWLHHQCSGSENIIFIRTVYVFILTRGSPYDHCLPEWTRVQLKFQSIVKLSLQLSPQSDTHRLQFKHIGYEGTVATPIWHYTCAPSPSHLITGTTQKNLRRLQLFMLKLPQVGKPRHQCCFSIRRRQGGHTCILRRANRATLSSFTWKLQLFMMKY